MIVIEKNNKADSRSCDVDEVSKQDLKDHTIQHISDVKACLSHFRYMLALAGLRHDLDKLSDIDAFYEGFKSKFEDTSWLDRHRSTNRHHLLVPEGVPDDVNLIDVLETLADHVVSGLSRSGDIHPLDLSPDLLTKALNNTIDLLKSEMEIVDTKCLDL